jgi:hypothetical protein
LALAAGIMHARQFFSRVFLLVSEGSSHHTAALLKHAVRTRAANGLACARRRRWAFWRWQFLWCVCAHSPAARDSALRQRGGSSGFALMFRCHVTVNGSRCDRVASRLASSVAHPVRPRSQRKRLHPIISPRTPLSRHAHGPDPESTHDASTTPVAAPHTSFTHPPLVQTANDHNRIINESRPRVPVQRTQHVRNTSAHTTACHL